MTHIKFCINKKFVSYYLFHTLTKNFQEEFILKITRESIKYRFNGQFRISLPRHAHSYKYGIAYQKVKFQQFKVNKISKRNEVTNITPENEYLFNSNFRNPVWPKDDKLCYSPNHFSVFAREYLNMRMNSLQFDNLIKNGQRFKKSNQIK